ncbi:MAG: hypothetical protein GXO43_09645, partial [Crenarchaeota archaeon]|nr:hypothetical protein [Thermoproteota archaeon]
MLDKLWRKLHKTDGRSRRKESTYQFLRTTNQYVVVTLLCREDLPLKLSN